MAMRTSLNGPPFIQYERARWLFNPLSCAKESTHSIEQHGKRFELQYVHVARVLVVSHCLCCTLAAWHFFSPSVCAVALKELVAQYGRMGWKVSVCNVTYVDNRFSNIVPS